MRIDPMIEIENLFVALGGKPRVEAFTLSVGRGTFHGLLGPNGAGKTTVLRTLYRAQTPDSGSIKIDGKPLNAWTRSDWTQTVAALVQEGGSLQGLTIRDVVDIGLMHMSLSPARRTARIDEALAIAGLTELADMEAALVSGGERQKMHIAQILARDPEVYILDEPSNHLDLCYQILLLDEINRRGKTVIATFHDLTLAARYCDEVTLMRGGQAITTGAPNAVLTRDNMRDVFKVQGVLRDGVMHIDAAIR